MASWHEDYTRQTPGRYVAPELDGLEYGADLSGWDGKEGFSGPEVDRLHAGSVHPGAQVVHQEKASHRGAQPLVVASGPAAPHGAAGSPASPCHLLHSRGEGGCLLCSSAPKFTTLAMCLVLAVLLYVVLTCNQKVNDAYMKGLISGLMGRSFVAGVGLPAQGPPAAAQAAPDPSAPLLQSEGRQG